MGGVSIYFFAGDFTDVLRRYKERRQQNYQTHDEVARLIYDLAAAHWQVTIYSFVTPDRRDEQPIEGVRIVSLGAKDYAKASLLAPAVSADDSDAIVAHFPNLELLRATIAKKKRAIAVMAGSYNRKGIRSTLDKWKVVSLLNHPRFELVSNHCLPATEQLAKIGVKQDKLIAWDVSHPFNPMSNPPKALTARQQRFEAAYVGTILEDKGVADLIRAIALLREHNIEIHCTLAGLGQIDEMQALGAARGVTDLLAFVRRIGNTDAFNLMVSADIVVVPSRTVYPEGFPLTMFEAIASRTPIVCSNHPMFRHVLVDGYNASVFPAGNHQALAAAMQRTLTDPVLYARLSRNATETWEVLRGPADWRTLIFKWVVEGRLSPWIREHMLAKVEKSAANCRMLSR
jgi:glycosyltransferase involved in cell wall biosynthesis